MLTPSFRSVIDQAIADRQRGERVLVEEVASMAADALSVELGRKRTTAGKVTLIKGVLDLAFQAERQGAAAS